MLSDHVDAVPMHTGLLMACQMLLWVTRWEWDATLHPANSVCEVSIREGHKKDTLGEYNHALLVLMKAPSIGDCPLWQLPDQGHVKL